MVVFERSFSFEYINTFKSAEAGAAGTSVTTVSSPAPPNSTELRCLKCAGHNFQSIWTSPTLTNNGLMTMGCYVRFEQVDAQTLAQDFITIQTGNNIHWRLRITHNTTTGNFISFVDANNSATTVISATALNADQWYLFEVIWTQGNDNQWLFYLDNSLITLLSNRDLQNGAGGDFTIRLKAQPAAAEITYYKNCYVANDCFILDGKVGHNACMAFRLGKNGVIPDCDETGATSSLHSISSGDFHDTSNGADTTAGGYTTDGDQGAVECDLNQAGGIAGPKGIFSDVTILGATWIWRIDGDTANNTRALYGNRNTSGTYIVTSVDTATTGVHYYNHFEEDDAAGTRVPESDENFLIGIGKVGVSANTVELREAWAILWFKVPFTLTPAATTTVHIKGGHIKGGLIK